MQKKYMWLNKLLSVGLVSFPLVLGCQKMDSANSGGKQQKSTDVASNSMGKMDLSEADKSLVVATVNGKTISQGELLNEVGPTLIRLRTESSNKEHAMKKRALDELVDNQLLEAEAKTRNISKDELLKKEVDEKVPPPDMVQMEAFFNQNKQRFPPEATFAQFKDQLAEAFSGRQKEEGKNAFVKTLRDKAKVEITLPFPELPSFSVSADDDPVKGSATAPVQIIEWSDFQCPYCKKNSDTLKQVAEKYKDKVAIVFRDFPLPFHDKAQKASEAAQCAHEQGKYWEYHDILFANPNALDIDNLKKSAEGLGLDKEKFNTCLDTSKYKAEVEKDMKDAQAVGVTGTPAIFINGKMLNGAVPFETYVDVIDSELAKAGKK